MPVAVLQHQRTARKKHFHGFRQGRSDRPARLATWSAHRCYPARRAPARRRRRASPARRWRRRHRHARPACSPAPVPRCADRACRGYRPAAAHAWSGRSRTPAGQNSASHRVGGSAQVASTRWRRRAGNSRLSPGVRHTVCGPSGISTVSRARPATTPPIRVRSWSYQKSGGLAWPVDTMRSTRSPGRSSRRSMRSVASGPTGSLRNRLSMAGVVRKALGGL